MPAKVWVASPKPIGAWLTTTEPRTSVAKPLGFQYSALASSTRAPTAPPSAMPRLVAPSPRFDSVPASVPVSRSAAAAVGGASATVAIASTIHMAFIVRLLARDRDLEARPARAGVHLAHVDAVAHRVAHAVAAVPHLATQRRRGRGLEAARFPHELAVQREDAHQHV